MQSYQQPWPRRSSTERPLLVLGTMNFGKRTPEPEAKNIVARALERGIRHFDTANAYVNGESERILGAALGPARGEAQIATKVGFASVRGKPEGLSGPRIHKAIDESLKRLKTDRVELYYLHVPDEATPLGETLEAMGEILAVGKAASFGVSNYASWQILEIMTLCESLGVPQPVVAQQLYNLLIRQLDLEFARFASAYSLHTMAYNALAGGLLTGKYRAVTDDARGGRFDGNAMYRGRYWSERFFDLVRDYEQIAREEGMGIVEFAYAFLASSPVVDSILLGPADISQLDQAIDACEKRLSAACLERIDAIQRAFQGTNASYAR